MSSHDAECNMGNIFRISQLVKYEKRGKYMVILHEAACNDYFIVKYLLKLNVTRVVLLTSCVNAILMQASVDFTMLTYLTSNLDSVKLPQ